MKANTLVEAVIGLVIGMALFPVVQSFANNASGSSSGVTTTLINLIPTLYVIILVAGAAAYVYYRSK